MWRKAGFTEARLLLCEGPDDKAFFERLIVARGLPPFHISDTSTPEAPRGGGNTGFGRALLAAQTNRNYQGVRHIVVVSDADAAPDESFSRVCDQIERAGYPRPAAPQRATAGRPSITVVMLPLNGGPGNLELCCVEAAQSIDQHIASCVEMFAAQLHAENWDAGRAGKLRLRALIAARAPDPFVFLGSVFRDHPELIPAAHESFDELTKLLMGLA